MQGNKLFKCIFKPFVMVTALVFSASALTASPEEAIKYRQGVMTALQWHMKIMSRMAQGHVVYDKAEFTKRAQNIADLSNMNYEGFLIKDSDLGDTRSKPEIWSSMDKFKSESDKFVTLAANLVLVSQGNDIKAIMTQFGDTLKGCDGCHATFRSN